jgi:broad specificity phosphatase PhoE
VTLYLVRHAMPAVDPTADPSTWPLSDQGRAAARDLAQLLPADALLLASDEPKAWQTLALSGERGVTRDRRLGEVRRPERFSDDFRVGRRRYVSGEALPGWEPQRAVADRFAAAVADAVRTAGPRDVVLASHGMAMTIWLTGTVGLPDPAAFWAGLRFPDLFRVDLATGEVTGAGLPAG